MEAPAAVEFIEACKQFGRSTALSGINLAIEAGTVHALVGENGAGKSTCLGLLSGRVAATSGSVRLFGSPLRTGDPIAARRAGVGAVYQELTMAPALTVADNVFLGRERHTSGVLQRRRMRSQFVSRCEHWGISLSAGTTMRQLSVADQQMVEVLRALAAEPRVILFDEPTAALAPDNKHKIHTIIRALRSAGCTVLFVSHDLDEVLELADRVSVFRDGRLIETSAAVTFTKKSLVESMLGREYDEFLDDAGKRAPALSANGLIEVEGMTIGSRLGPLTFALRPGEILGVGGLVGSGRTTLLRGLAGAERGVSGRIVMDGRQYTLPRTVAEARRRGVGLVPEDRKTEGLLLSLPARDNILVSGLGSVSRYGVLSSRKMEAAAQESARRVGFDSRRLGARASVLSGGNQQKLLLARWEHCRPRLLLADEPTRGIDVGAKAEIMRSLRRSADAGASVVFVSSDLEEVAAIADRVLCLRAGQAVGEVHRVNGAISVVDILAHSFGTEM